MEMEKKNCHMKEMVEGELIFNENNTCTPQLETVHIYKYKDELNSS